MVKAAKTAKRMGRPPKDVGDLRTERIAMRAHPDLLSHLNDLARRAGIVRSVYIERILIGYVNDLYGEEVLDAIGKEIPDGGPAPSGRLKRLQMPHRDRDRVLHDDVMPSTTNAHPARRFKR
jgi:hypothetical protein